MASFIASRERPAAHLRTMLGEKTDGPLRETLLPARSLVSPYVSPSASCAAGCAASACSSPASRSGVAAIARRGLGGARHDRGHRARGAGHPRRGHRLLADPAAGRRRRSGPGSTGSARSRRSPPCAAWPGAPMAATRRWSRSRRSTAAIRSTAASPSRAAARAADLLAERDGTFGALAEPELISRLGLEARRYGPPRRCQADAPRRDRRRAGPSRGRLRPRPAADDRPPRARRGPASSSPAA